VTWGVHPEEELRNAGAHRVTDAFDDLHDIIEGLTNEGFSA
jgi:phosphoglycolate phosphatase-like HAD superfamily hydrolase